MRVLLALCSLPFVVGIWSAWVGWLPTWSCPFALWELPCLSCGLTRSLALSAKLQFEEALQLHAWGPHVFFISAVGAGLGIIMSGRALIVRNARHP